MVNSGFFAIRRAYASTSRLLSPIALRALQRIVRVAVDYDLQTKCAKNAQTWFRENWPADKDTILLNFTAHYSAEFNKCVILVEYHYNSRLAAPGGESWTNDMNLCDVYENSKYAQFDENHYTYWKPKYSTGDEVISCTVSRKQCKTGEEFNNLVSQYMTD